MLKITIHTGNAAFHDPGGELARILQAAARKAETQITPGEKHRAPLHDVNGNKVGEFVYNGKED